MPKETTTSTPPPIPEDAGRKREKLPVKPPPLPAINKIKPAERREGGPVFTLGASTEASIEHQQRNEDAYVQSPRRGIVGVFDGMGGVPAGERAADRAARQLGRDGLEEAVTHAKTAKEKAGALNVQKFSTRRLMPSSIKPMLKTPCAACWCG